MSEKKLVIDQMKLTYEGLFDIQGLWRIINSWFYEKGFDMWELKNYEQVLPTGKDIEIEIMPWKKPTDYFKNSIRIRIKITDAKDVEVEKEGVKLKLNQGKLRIIFDAYIESDYENKWESVPIFYFLRAIFDKYIFRPHFNRFEKWLVNDVYDLHGRIQKFLNLYRYEKHV